MKKIMLVAAAAVAGQLMAESLVSDIVGFKKDATKADYGYSLMTSSFATPKDANAKFSLADLSVSGYEANSCTRGEFALNVLTKSGRVEACYYWVDDGSLKGWYYEDDYGDLVAADAANISFSPATALWINSKGYQLVTAGLVNKNDIAFQTPDGSDACGIANGTAADLTFGKLTVSGYSDYQGLDDYGEATGGCEAGDFVMQKLDGYGRVEQALYWIDNGCTPGWYLDPTAEEPADLANTKFVSGDGYWTFGNGYTLNIPAPDLDGSKSN